MKVKKLLSLLLSIVSLNLFTNYNSCFSMNYENYSVTEVAIDGYTNCLICSAQRSTKLVNNQGTHKGTHALRCPGCGSHCSYKNRSRFASFEPNHNKACRYCGCRRFHLNGNKGIQAYMCSNCKKSGFETYLLSDSPQLWKQGFCKYCNTTDGVVMHKLIRGSRDCCTNKRIKKEDRIKYILRNPDGFDYYCYTCGLKSHVTLTPEEAERVCQKYDESLNNL